MARKKKPPEHENLERWLVSYADFMTLLFATFVVLYALSQIDIASSFGEMQKSLRKAFSAPALLQGGASVMDKSGDSMMDEKSGDTMVNTLMLEYISQKYEQESYEQIKEELAQMQERGELETSIDTEKGLIIRINKSDILFEPGSAELTPRAKILLDKIGATIKQKFKIHLLKVEGHTDSQPFSNAIYPSNWELSAARAGSIARFFIKTHKFDPAYFTIVGHADTRPIAENDTAVGRAKNRRVEIVVTRNKYRKYEGITKSIMKLDKAAQQNMQDSTRTVNKVKEVDYASQYEQSSKYSKDKVKQIKDLYKNEVKNLDAKMKTLN